MELGAPIRTEVYVDEANIAFFNEKTERVETAGNWSDYVSQAEAGASLLQLKTQTTAGKTVDEAYLVYAGVSPQLNVAQGLTLIKGAKTCPAQTQNSFCLGLNSEETIILNDDTYVGVLAYNNKRTQVLSNGEATIAINNQVPNAGSFLDMPLKRRWQYTFVTPESDQPKFVYTDITIDASRYGYDLRLMSVSATDELVKEGRSLVIVALVGAKLHIRIFDAGGEFVDKAEEELIDGETLTALKKRLTQLPEEASISQQDKQEIIDTALSIADHTPGYIFQAAVSDLFGLDKVWFCPTENDGDCEKTKKVSSNYLLPPTTAVYSFKKAFGSEFTGEEKLRALNTRGYFSEVTTSIFFDNASDDVLTRLEKLRKEGENKLDRIARYFDRGVIPQSLYDRAVAEDLIGDMERPRAELQEQWRLVEEALASCANISGQFPKLVMCINTGLETIATVEGNPIIVEPIDKVAWRMHPLLSVPFF